MANPLAPDVIGLVYKATLELYGVELDLDKTLRLVGLLHAVAEGERTFVDSDADPAVAALRAQGEAYGIDTDAMSRAARAGEREAARWLAGMPAEDEEPTG